ERVRAIAGGLAALGVSRGQTVGCMLVNRPELHLADAAAMHLGAAGFSLYNTSPPAQLAHVLRDAAPRVVVSEPQFLARLREGIAIAGVDVQIVLVEGRAPGTLTFEQLSAPPGFDFDASWEAVAPGDVATLIYTSGTTGPPKGVELTHANVLAECRALQAHFELPMGGRTISYLPAAHVADRMLAHYAGMTRGLAVTCCADAGQLLAAAIETRPTIFAGVPRVWEKLAAALETQLGPRPQLDADAAAALRAQLGLDQVEAFLVGAAPTPERLFAFFAGVGIELIEGWGMSELSCMATMGVPGAARPGSVGVPLPGVELRLDDDGEVLVRGPIVMRGYRNRPDDTAAALDADGWLRTGDVGTLDEHGHLRIVDRKKELIVNAAGKNMSPTSIETQLTLASPLIGHAVAIGDRRPYNVALLALDPDAAAAWAARAGIEAASLAQLAAHPQLLGEVAGAVERANAQLARVEQIKRFRLLDHAWEADGDELTPTLKLRRRPIVAKYAREIDALYDEQPLGAHGGR
ncbi:MAG TPA: AMP-binding protein, partial [Conexibacter sp.]|nr:AMP-binding protein [Conexibacter sp.]